MVVRQGRFALVAVVLAGMAGPPAALRAQDAGVKPPADAPAPATPPKDTRPVSSDEAAKAALDRFERDFKARDEHRRMGAIQSLSDTKNDLVTKKLASLLLHREVDVRRAAAMVLRDMYQNVALAGETLRKRLSKEDDDEVLMDMLASVGELKHVDAIPELGDLCEKHGNVFVKIECLRAFRRMGDRRALIPILRLWLKEPHGYSWEGGEVTVDTGAPGTADQEAAEAEYKAKYGNSQRHGAPPMMLKTYVQTLVETVAALCGEKIPNPSGLMRWLVVHEKELDFELPAMVKTTLKEWDDRAEKKKKKS